MKNFLRGANIVIFGLAILCLMIPLLGAWFYIPLTLFILLQLGVFATFISFETMTAGSFARHAIVFVLVLATVGGRLFHHNEHDVFLGAAASSKETNTD